MANFENNFVNFAMFGLMIISIFAFVIITQSQNNAPEKIIDNDLINQTYSDLGGEITKDTASSESNYISFNENNPTIDSGQIVLSTIVSGGKVFSSMIFGFYNIIIKLPARILGIDEKILGIIFTILIIVIIIGLYTLIRVGG
jgi:hypothetical protein